MKKLQILGVALVALFILGSLVSVAFAEPTFLLAEWLAEGSPITTALLAEGSGEVTLIDLDAGGLSVTIEILCSAIGDGTVGSGSLGEVTEVLNLSGETISKTALSGLALTCSNTEL